MKITIPFSDILIEHMLKQSNMQCDTISKKLDNLEYKINERKIENDIDNDNLMKTKELQKKY